MKAPWTIGGVGVLVVLAFAGCGDAPKKRLGSVCGSDEECASGVCIQAVCMDPAADNDGDTLPNGLEESLGTNALDVDTDADGIGDRAELGPALEESDADGDGLIDARESLTADGDGDCIVDQLDVQNEVVDPEGCLNPTELPRDCAEAKLEGIGDGPARIDVDGRGGPNAPFDVTCDQTTAGGGWTSVVGGYQPTTERAGHEFLFVKGAAWVTSPPVFGGPTGGGWGVSIATVVPGAWSGTDGVQDVGFECAGDAAPSGIGIGCAEVDGGAFRVETWDAATATARVCGEFAQVIFGAACTDGVKVFARGRGCTPAAGSVIGDPGLVTATAGQPGGCWNLVSVLGEVLVDANDKPEGVATGALRFGAASSSEWAVTLVQGGFTLAKGHAYRIGLWVKSAEAVDAAMVVNGSDGELVFASAIDAQGSWRFFERGFVAKKFESPAQLELVFSGQGTVRIAALVLEDLGAGACATGEGFATADRGFDGRLACWGVEAGNDAAPWWLSVVETADLPEGGASPVLEVESLATEPVVDANYLWQEPLTLGAGRWYRMGGWFDGTAGGEVELTFAVPETGDLGVVGKGLAGEGWERVETDFLGPSLGTTAGWFHVKIAPPSGTVMRVDDLGVMDLGPSPCAAADGDLVRDGGFVGGVLCWEASTLPEGGKFFRDDVSAPPGGSAPALGFTGATNAEHNLWDAQLAQRDFQIVKGRNYQLAFESRATQDTTVVVVVHDWVDFNQHFYQVVNVPAGQWSTYVFDFVGLEDDQDAVVEFQLGETRTGLWLDAVSITQSAP